VTMNHDGSVKNAMALSDPKLLVAMAIDNARKWRFVPNRQRRAVLVFEFRIEGVCADGATSSLFRLLHPKTSSLGGWTRTWSRSRLNPSRSHGTVKDDASITSASETHSRTSPGCGIGKARSHRTGRGGRGQPEQIRQGVDAADTGGTRILR
jgi:hypothetical protein